MHIFTEPVTYIVIQYYMVSVLDIHIHIPIYVIICMQHIIPLYVCTYISAVSLSTVVLTDSELAASVRN